MPSGLHKIFRGPITRGIFSKKRLPKLTTLRQKPKVYLQRDLIRQKRSITPKDPGTAVRRGQPLYNAKRVIPTASGPTQASLKKLSADHNDESWRNEVSQDVKDFVDDMEAQRIKLLPEELYKLLKDPATYFSRPQNVPESLREQRYFPRWPVVLVHPGRWGSHYAKFQCPLEMNKLDLKDYLKNMYNVEVVHIRSYVTHGKLRQKRVGRQRGPWIHGRSLKFMIAQLVVPFKWPDVNKDALPKKKANLSLDRRSGKEASRESLILSDTSNMKLKQKHRDLISRQAQEMLQGRLKWSPTWQHFPEQRRNMLGKYANLLPKPPSDPGPESRAS